MIKVLLKKNEWTEEQIVPIRQAKRNFFRINWIKTIWFNFRALPFKQAVRFPFVLAYHTRIKRVGKIILEGRVSPFMISFGLIRLNTDSTSEKIVWSNKGTVFFKGRTIIHKGVKISIREGGFLSFGARIKIGSLTKIVCTCKITIGNDFRMGWESQMFDTNFHFLTNIQTGKIYNRKKPVLIGNEVWIGNRCSIGKGTIIPNGAVVSCCSRVLGDMTKEGDYPLIMGNPASIVKVGIKMGNSWYPQIEQEIANRIES